MSARKRHLLLAAYHFPPMGGSGVQRPLGFARHLPAAAWRPTVLCAGHEQYGALDPSLAAELPASVRVERLAGWEPAGWARRIARGVRHRRAKLDVAAKAAGATGERRLYWMLQSSMPDAVVPEPEWLWAQSARGAARKLVAADRADAVMTSGGPFSVHLIGLHLQRRMGIPWIADWRDPLVGNFAYAPRRPWIDRYWRRLERTIVHRANLHVVTCPEHGEDLKRRYPRLASNRVMTLTNGYEPHDFSPPLPARTGPAAARFTIAHVGSFYRQQSLEPLLEVIRAWIAMRPAQAGAVRLALIGTLSAEQRRLIQPQDATFIEERGYVDHATAVREMRQAELLYLTAPDSAGGRLCVPAKSFEYLASGRPILATIPGNTWLRGLLERSGGTTFPADQTTAGLVAALDQCHLRWKKSPHAHWDRSSELESFRRAALAGRLAAALEEVVKITDARDASARRRDRDGELNWEEAA